MEEHLLIIVLLWLEYHGKRKRMISFLLFFISLYFTWMWHTLIFNSWHLSNNKKMIMEIYKNIDFGFFYSLVFSFSFSIKRFSSITPFSWVSHILLRAFYFCCIFWLQATVFLRLSMTFNEVFFFANKLRLRLLILCFISDFSFFLFSSRFSMNILKYCM